MRELRPDKNIISVGGNDYNIVLTLSVIEELQKDFDNLNDVFETLSDLTGATKELANIATIFINDDIQCHNEDFPSDKKELITPEWLYRRIALNDTTTQPNKILAVDLSLAMMRAFQFSMPEVDGAEESDPNE